MALDLRDAILAVDARAEQHLVQHRRDLHKNPELSDKELETTRYILERLDDLGLDNLHQGPAGTGVVADVKGRRPGRSVLLRADIDGLPISERSDLPFKSTRPGVMHACGHDVHMAIALELADTFAVNRDQLPGLVRFVFQPAEETGSGAKRMIEAGVLDGIDRVMGLHVWSQLPVGQVSIRPDAVMASGDFFTLTINGKAAHGAQPHLGVDAIVIAAQVITALQTLASRETAAASPVVITIGSVRGGTAPNVLSGEVVLQGTLRTFDKELRGTLLKRIAELADGIATAMRGRSEFRLDSEAPPVINDPATSEVVSKVARSLLGNEAVVPFEPLMVAEDFSYFLEARPGCFFLLGGAPGGAPVAHHTPEFRIDERCLAIGYRVMGAAVLRLLEQD
jgi:amidohydrolase